MRDSIVVLMRSADAICCCLRNLKYDLLLQEARKRLTTSVSEKGRELARVWEWNEQYGEIKKKGGEQSSRHNLAMYL
jgi:hypothetical protein